VLWKADSLIGRIWLNVMARRLALFVFAALIAVFGLGMANVSGFYALQAPPLGLVWAAAVVAIVDFILAAIVLAFASRVQPGSEIELAHEVRKMAIASHQSDFADIKLAVDSLRQDIRQTKDSIAGFIHDPLSGAAERLLVPAALSLLKGLRGVEKVASEWGLVCLAHNILKLAQGRTPSPAALATG
jgi:hypothetical protein